jgi:hypothetical protein
MKRLAALALLGFLLGAGASATIAAWAQRVDDAHTFAASTGPDRPQGKPNASGLAPVSPSSAATPVPGPTGPSPTATAGSLPYAQAPGCRRQAPAIRPSRLVLVCDLTEYVTHLKWASWTPTASAAHGIFHIRACSPTCRAGKTIVVSGSLRLSLPERCDNGRVMFAEAVATFDSPVGGHRLDAMGCGPYLELDRHGLGALPFGSPATRVISALTSTFGHPTSDTGWVMFKNTTPQSSSQGAFCSTRLGCWEYPLYRETCWRQFCADFGGKPGVTAFRGWVDSALITSSFSVVHHGDLSADPPLRTDDGIGIGTPFQLVRALHPHMRLLEGEGGVMTFFLWPDQYYYLSGGNGGVQARFGSNGLVIPPNAEVFSLDAGTNPISPSAS